MYSNILLLLEIQLQILKGNVRIITGYLQISLALDFPKVPATPKPLPRPNPLQKQPQSLYLSTKIPTYPSLESISVCLRNISVCNLHISIRFLRISVRLHFLSFCILKFPIFCNFF
jgi:hypothetical protein